QAPVKPSGAHRSSAVGWPPSRRARLRVEDDFGPAVGELVELVVGAEGIREWQLVRDDLRWPGLAADDEVAQPAVVAHDRALARPDGDALGERGAVVKVVAAVPGIVGRGALVGRLVDADHADLAGGPDHLDQR